jgi:activator of HSP90 ATPase
MTTPIHQRVVFGATPAKLYALFMDSARHAAATGAPARISRKIGGNWQAHAGMIGGRNLVIVPNRLIVQTWRSMSWSTSDPDSILIVRFEKTPAGTLVDLVHVGVPPYDHKGVTQGWRKYYWKPWKKYLASRQRAL